MKRSLSIILLSTIFLLGYQIYITNYNPCDKPVYYRVGTVDPKFGMKEDDVIKSSEEAADLLSNEYGKKLFLHDAESTDLTVNFVYDERSALNSEINEKLGTIDKENSSLQQTINAYEADANAFQKKLDEFNRTVETYNRQGGAPPGVYGELIKEQQKLQAEAEVLNRRADQLNLATKNYNLQVSDLNSDVTEFNQALTQKPEEGLYDPNNNTITIYFVNNRPELIHTLTHEFGHALGMDHVNNEKAIMYPLSSTYTDLAEEDISELYKACKDIPAYEYWYSRLIKSLQK